MQRCGRVYVNGAWACAQVWRACVQQLGRAWAMGEEGRGVHAWPCCACWVGAGALLDKVMAQQECQRQLCAKGA